ncbi:hypothetical protein AMECASPLE_038556 [Ameca splendens]|uniref:Uncharacterized protein n=1 Tax=Ameca splendens TaxID=208324 RepID=A0ABV1AEL5_9TELE
MKMVLDQNFLLLPEVAAPPLPPGGAVLQSSIFSSIRYQNQTAELRVHTDTEPSSSRTAGLGSGCLAVCLNGSNMIGTELEV